jgi:putative endopeptidase
MNTRMSLRSAILLALVATWAPSAWSTSRNATDPVASVDAAVKPGDDFEGYVNNRWRNRAEMPPDQESVGVVDGVGAQAQRRTAEIIENAGRGNPAAGSAPRLIADYYRAYMDEEGIEKAGLAPLEPALAAIDTINDTAQLSTALGGQLRADVDLVNMSKPHTEHLFGLFVAQGLEDPSKNLPYLLQGGLGMPDRDYYLKADKDTLDIRSRYAAYVEAVLSQAATPDADRKAKAIVALETKIAQAQASIVESEDIHKANNAWARTSFASKAPGIDWDAYFKAARLDDQPTFIVWQPATVTKIAALVASEPLDTWKAWLRFHTINADANGLLPKAYDGLYFGFYGKTLSGTLKQRDRWKRGATRVNADLGDAVGQIYVKEYFPPSSRAQVQEMVKNILKAFDARVDTLEWMSPETRHKAKAKIATINVGVGYPDTWRDYSKLDIRPDDALGNHERADIIEYRHQLAKLGKPVDRNEWWIDPQIVNALNLPLQNALNFPAALIEPPFFDPKADAASNYGAIGATIGHEISHSFDNTGAEFDAQGRLANWWTDADRKHFKEAGQRLVDQYNLYEPLPGLHINGQQTLGENIADLSGLTIAYAAYEESLHGKPAPVIDGLTGEQRFFLAFARSWRWKLRDAAMRQIIVTNGHAPPAFRAQTVRNVDAWYDAFNPTPHDKLYLSPDQRVRIW